MHVQSLQSLHRRKILRYHRQITIRQCSDRHMTCYTIVILMIDNAKIKHSCMRVRVRTVQRVVVVVCIAQSSEHVCLERSCPLHVLKQYCHAHFHSYTLDRFLLWYSICFSVTSLQLSEQAVPRRPTVVPMAQILRKLV
jgi:hypothetical protein